MKETKGRADGGEVTRLIREKLGSASGATRSLCNKLLQGWHTRGMAWNVVIAGGGFAGATLRAELERLLPKQSARLVARQRRQLPALHAVPARGRGGHARAAPRGHAAARHPQAHLPAARRGHRPRPGAPARSSCAPTRARSRSCATTSSCSRSARSRGSLPVPGPRPARDRLQEPRRRDLAAQPRDRDARGGERDRGPRAPRGAAHLRLRRRRLRRARGARRAAGLRRRRDGRATRGRGCTGCAGSWSRRPTGCCPRSTPKLADYARRASSAAAASTSASAPASRRSSRRSATLSTGETIPTRTVVWTAGVAPHPSLAQLERAARRARPGRRSTSTCASRAWTASGRSATAPRSPTPSGGICAADRAARDPPGQGRRAQHRRRARRRRGRAPFTLPRARARSSTSAATRRSASSGRLHVLAASSPGGWPAPTT